MGPKKKKGCITILLFMIIFAVSGGCIDNRVTNAPIDAGDNVEDVHNSKDHNTEEGGN